MQSYLATREIRAEIMAMTIGHKTLSNYLLTLYYRARQRVQLLTVFPYVSISYHTSRDGY